jgi:hypothetical protein
LWEAEGALRLLAGEALAEYRPGAIKTANKSNVFTGIRICVIISSLPSVGVAKKTYGNHRLRATPQDPGAGRWQGTPRPRKRFSFEAAAHRTTFTAQSRPIRMANLEA